MRLLLRSSGLRYASLGGAGSEYSSSLPSKKLGFRFIVTSCRAVLLPRFGGPEVLEVRNDASVPDLKPNQVLVRARAVSVNPLDTRVSSSAFLSLRLVWLSSEFRKLGECWR